MSLRIEDRYDELKLRNIKQSIDDLRTQKEDGWQEKAIKIIRKSRFDDVDLELMRLRFFNVLNPEIEKNLDLALGSWGSWDDYKNKAVKVIMAQAMEIQKIYRETHHVFIHGQSSQWLLFADLIKELMKIYYPEQDVHQFKFLRMPTLSRSWDITRYSKSDFVYDHDPDGRMDLLSVDGYFFHNSMAESCMDFVKNNANIMASAVPFHILQDVIQHFQPDMSLEEVNDYIARLRAVSNAALQIIGNIFVLCIPKDRSDSIQYRAHPYGIPCHCHPESETFNVLESLQRMDKLDPTVACLNNDPCPQFRIFTPALTKENGVKIYLLTPDHPMRKQFKEKIRNIIREFASRRPPVALEAHSFNSC